MYAIPLYCSLPRLCSFPFLLFWYMMWDLPYCYFSINTWFIKLNLKIASTYFAKSSYKSDVHSLTQFKNLGPKSQRWKKMTFKPSPRDSLSTLAFDSIQSHVAALHVSIILPLIAQSLIVSIGCEGGMACLRSKSTYQTSFLVDILFFSLRLFDKQQN